MRFVMRSKIHKAIVTESNLQYIGSITIDELLIEKVGLWPNERVQVVSNTSGARIETYVIAGVRDSGIICVNGAAAHCIQKGEEVIIIGYELTDKPVEMSAILVNRKNKFIKYLQEIKHVNCK